MFSENTKLVKKKFSITFNNVSSKDVSITIFKRNLTPPHGGTFYHVRCCCHIINLIVQDDMEVFNVHKENK